MKIQIKNSSIRLGLFVMAIAFFAACGNNNKNENKNVETEIISSEEQSETQLEASAAPDISFMNEDGETVTLSSLKGNVVFINFWATWCPPCIYELPSINELKSTLGNDDIVFVMVDVDNDMEKSTAFMRENNYDLPVYVAASDIPTEYLGGAIPTTVILDKSGEMVVRIEGGRDFTEPEIVQALKELVESN